MRPVMAILREIEAFAPVNGEWRSLDGLLAELWAVGVREGQLPVLFGVFERYPEEDGGGVLWSIVHGIEALPINYEAALRESLSLQPSLMGKVMLQRLEKSRAPITGNVSWRMNKTLKFISVYVLGFATLIPPALFFLDFHALFVSVFFGLPLILISLIYGSRNLSRDWSGLVWVLALFFAWFLVLPVFWFFKIYLPYRRNQLTLAGTDGPPVPRDD